MDMQLTANEARVIGCLIEKQVTTPDQYPLTLNALTNACNQKSNREPVMELDETQVQGTLDALSNRRLVSEKFVVGSRVPKYLHRFCNTEFSALKLSPQELGLICALLLRGPQTPGELRTRTQRLCTFKDVHEVQSVLDGLARRDGGPLVVQLAREPGRRESRYAHLFSGLPAEDAAVAASPASPAPAGDAERLANLEQQVAQLQDEVAALRRLISERGTG